jgi:hypothetical protein
MYDTGDKRGFSMRHACVRPLTSVVPMRLTGWRHRGRRGWRRRCSHTPWAIASLMCGGGRSYPQRQPSGPAPRSVGESPRQLGRERRPGASRARSCVRLRGKTCSVSSVARASVVCTMDRRGTWPAARPPQAGLASTHTNKRRLGKTCFWKLCRGACEACVRRRRSILRAVPVRTRAR